VHHGTAKFDGANALESHWVQVPNPYQGRFGTCMSAA